MQPQKVSLRDMSISSFLSSSMRRLDNDSEQVLRRHVQSGVFEEIWGRLTNPSTSDVVLQKTFANVGLLTSTLFANAQGRLSSRFLKELSKKPMIGHLRSRVSFHDDIRFVVKVINDTVYLLLDNSAINSRMSTVMRYDTEIEAFVDVRENLLDFVLNNELVV